MSVFKCRLLNLAGLRLILGVTITSSHRTYFVPALWTSLMRVQLELFDGATGPTGRYLKKAVSH